MVNEYGSRRIPFLFLVDFEMEKPEVFQLKDVSADTILYNINGRTNCEIRVVKATSPELKKTPPPFEDYKKKFDQVWDRLVYGDSYLTNLTIKTKVDTSLSLKELFFCSQAKYKVWFNDQFLVFSPETFVRIVDGNIFSFPMKGTIDASQPDAMRKILADPKEMAEHVTIVDLIRNDLSAVAEDIQVTRFRFVDEIKTMQKNLLQVSSEIRGRLEPDYHNR